MDVLIVSLVCLAYVGLVAVLVFAAVEGYVTWKETRDE
jgi:uncharacterized protein YuzB (UPF0349 family)